VKAPVAAASAPGPGSHAKGSPEHVSPLDPETASRGMVLTAELRVQRQLRWIFERAGVVSFAQVLDLVGPGADYDAVLEQVKKIAVLVRGNWVRGTHLYTEVPPTLVDVRNLLLVLLHRYGAVNRMQLVQKLGYKGEEVLQLLRPLAALDKARGMWTLKAPDDTEFLAKFPALVAQQEAMWQALEKDLEGLLMVLGAPECDFPGPVEVHPAALPPANVRPRPALARMRIQR
jgi:hypothetical protein